MDRKRKWVSAIYCNTSILNILCDKRFLKLSHMYHDLYHGGTVEWLRLDFFISDVYTELCVHCTHLYPPGVWEGGVWRVDRSRLEIVLQCSHVQKPVSHIQFCCVHIMLVLSQLCVQTSDFVTVQNLTLYLFGYKPSDFYPNRATCNVQ